MWQGDGACSDFKHAYRTVELVKHAYRTVEFRYIETTTFHPASVHPSQLGVTYKPSRNCHPTIFLCDTAGVKKTKNIPLCHVAHELTSRTYGEKKCWVVIVKDQ